MLQLVFLATSIVSAQSTINFDQMNPHDNAPLNHTFECMNYNDCGNCALADCHWNG